MDIKLSWDLFIAVFFIIIVAYSFIIGLNGTIKVILGTYVAIVCADAIGLIFSQYVGGTEMFLQMIKEANFSGEVEAIIFAKVIVFLLMVILFAVKGAFSVGVNSGGALKIVLHLIYSVCSAGLIVSSLLVLVSGVSILNGGGVVSEALSSLTDNSILALNVVYYHTLWFAAPAVVFLVHSLKRGQEG
jgi:hypothetical protein